jgi:hypothetical protein
MKNICPISNKIVDENTVRITSGISIILLAIALIFNQKIILTILLIDFFARGFIDSSYSIIHKISKTLKNIFKINTKPINAGPKLFAAQVGFFLTLIITAAMLVNHTAIAYGFGILLGICALAEAVFGFCIACKLYPIFRG